MDECVTARLHDLWIAVYLKCASQGSPATQSTREANYAVDEFKTKFGIN